MSSRRGSAAVEGPNFWSQCDRESPTFFKNVGSAVAVLRHGTSRFRVSQVVQLFDDPDLAADQGVADMRRTVHGYMELFMSPTSTPRVTLFECADVRLLLDGNKTALAAYLHSQQPSRTSYSLPVYWLNAPRLASTHLFE